MSVSIGLAGLLVSFVVFAVLHGGVIRAGCRSTNETVPNWGWAIGAGLITSLSTFVLTLPMSCGIGCAVGTLAYPVSLLLQCALGAVVSGIILSRVISIPTEKALSIQTLWWVFMFAWSLVMWGGMRLAGIWF